MYRKELCTFTAALCLGLAFASPVTTFATETNAQTDVLLKDGNHKNKGNFEEKMRKAKEKWDSLSDKQKEEIYALLENEIQVETKMFNKLVELGVMEKEDAEKSIGYLNECLSKIRKNGTFPFCRSK